MGVLRAQLDAMTKSKDKWKADTKAHCRAADVPSPSSADGEAERAAKRQCVAEAHQLHVYTGVAEAAGASPPRDGETVAVLGVRVKTDVTERAKSAQAVNRMRVHLAELDTTLGIDTLSAMGVRKAAVQTQVCDGARLARELKSTQEQLKTAKSQRKADTTGNAFRYMVEEHAPFKRAVQTTTHPDKLVSASSGVKKHGGRLHDAMLEAHKQVAQPSHAR